MKAKWIVATGLPLIVVLVALAVWHNTENRGPPPSVVNLSCPDPVAGCVAQIGNRAVSVGMAGERKPLKPFQVWVKAAGADAVQASFTMVGMNMGLNHYTLQPDRAGVFRAQVTLPICVSGRREWVLTLDIDEASRVIMPFAIELP
jgi:hypothetical protein